MMDGRWMLRRGRERDEVRNDGVGLDGVCLGGYGAFLFVLRPPQVWASVYRLPAPCHPHRYNFNRTSHAFATNFARYTY
jgi:dienelactone hydrolase